MLTIGPLERSELDAITRQARVIERDAHGIKVLELPDGRYLKYFRCKRTFNRELMVPAAVRFARNVRQLQRLGIATMEVDALHRIVGESHTVAIYRPLPGDTLRHLFAAGDVNPALMYRLGRFMADVHRLGIYFRSIHSGNIIVNERGFGLIDVLDMRIRPWSLTRWGRRRNWLHFFRFTEEWKQQPGLIEALLKGYRETADLPVTELRRLPLRVHHILAA